ncbi:uncharacterized protein [Anoplolepis gracilipes]|uniref:uncharacterized protein n=1 Tax=Anoplolepis gracilipes TaxID=354296 RepID=UPI003B9E1285
MAFLKNLKNQPIEGELAIALSKSYPFHKRGFVQIGEKKWFLPYKCTEQGNINKIFNFETRPDDTWIITFPRSGTTMTQELIWLVANDLNFDEARRRHLTERFPYLDLSLIVEDDVLANDTPEEQKISKYSIEFVQNQPLPRFIKSHFPLDLLPTVVNNDCKIIYVARNVKSVAVSWYYFQKDLKLYEGTFEQMCDDFMNDHSMWAPYWEHVKTAWAIRHKPNVLFLFYEDLRKNLVENIKKIATFFGKTYNEEQIVKLAEHLNIENFRKNPMVNRPTRRVDPKVFIRQGKTDSWKELFTPELEKRFNKWIVDNLKDTDLIFPNRSMAFLKNLKNQPIEGELAIALSKSYPLHKHGFVQIGEKKWFLPYKCTEQGNINKVFNFETRPDDTWIITFLRSGTTLTQELTWLVANDLNFDEARRRHLIERFPFLDLGLIVEDDVLANDTPEEQKISKYSIEFVQNQSSPRFIKSHLALDLLPTVVNNCKIIYVARNPRNVVVSWYFFIKDIKQVQYQGTFEQLCNDFMNDHSWWAPYWEHVKTAWAIRHKPNILFLFYEDLTKSLAENIKNIAAFFGKTYNDEQIVKLAEHLNIENFRKNPMVNQPAPGQQINPKSFIRQGKADSWKELFTPELEKRFNEWVVDNLKNTDLIFPD